MQDFQTNPWVFAAICLGWVALVGSFGAYKCFFEEPKEIDEEAG